MNAPRRHDAITTATIRMTDDVPETGGMFSMRESEEDCGRNRRRRVPKSRTTQILRILLMCLTLLAPVLLLSCSSPIDDAADRARKAEADAIAAERAAMHRARAAAAAAQAEAEFYQKVVWILVAGLGTLTVIVLVRRAPVKPAELGSTPAPGITAAPTAPATPHASIFVIGSEGAGKTTFLAGLSRYATSNAGDFLFDPCDFRSAKYVSAALDLLERRKWPKSNPQGDLTELRWNIGRANGPLHEFVLFDYSGQDMRSVLLEENVETLDGKPKELRQRVDSSNLLIYLLDLNELIGAGSVQEAGENLWLLRTFLTRSAWKGKKRLLVLTKSDLYTDLIEDSDGDLRLLLSRHLSGVPGGSSLGHELENVECLMIASVVTKTVLSDNSDPLRLPELPLSSEGFPKLLETILHLVTPPKGIFGFLGLRSSKVRGKSPQRRLGT